MHGIVRDGTYVKNETEKGMLRMSGGSWTINLDEIANQDVARIVYFTERYIYRISYDKAHKEGFHKELAGEEKLVVPIKYLKKEER